MYGKAKRLPILLSNIQVKHLEFQPSIQIILTYMLILFINRS